MAIGYKEQSASSVPTPPSGQQYTFIDTADGKVKRKDSTGTVTLVESAGGAAASSIAFTPAGDLIATDVQAALEELDTEKAPLTHVGSNGVSQHAVATGSAAGFMSPSDFTKLAGIASGATANDTDANLKNRANHTGTQLASTISDLASAAKTAVVDDFINDGVTDKAPSQNSVYDALALKQNISTLAADAKAAVVIDSIADSDTDHAPSRNAVYDALALKVDKAGDTMTGQLIAPSVKHSGTAGAGFGEFVSQSSDPSTPASGFKFFADSTGKFAWKGTDGFKRTFDASANTADRVYTLPDQNAPILVDPMTAAGSMIRRNASNQNVDLPIGAEDTILRVVSGLPEWVEENLSQDIGGGDDGSVAFSGSFTATDILYYDTLTINAGTVFNPDAYIIYAKTLDLTNATAGAFTRSGNPGTNSANNTGGAGGTAFTARVLATNSAGGAGAAGQTNAGVQGGAGGNVSVGNGGSGGASGASGAGGTGAGAAAIAGGAVTTNISFGRFEYQFIRGATQVSGGAGGRGGNSGGGDGANSSRGGGGGGAGGAVLVLIVGNLITGPSTPAGVIVAKGGQGGSQSSAPASGNVGGAGGGGGGGGGYIYIAYVKKTGATVVNLIDASGGNGGNGSNGLGTGIGGNGGQGGSSGRIQLFNVTEGMGTLTVGGAGSNGTAGSGVTGGTGGSGGVCQASL